MSRWPGRQVAEEPLYLLSREQSEAVGRRILGGISVPSASLSVSSQVTAITEFARGDTHIAAERASAMVGLSVTDSEGRTGSSSTNRLDDKGLEQLIVAAEAAAAEHMASRTAGTDAGMLGPQTYPPGPELFYDAALPAMAPPARAEVFEAVAAANEATGMVAAGSLTFELASRAVLNTKGLFAYERRTYGELSITSRTADGRGSGWAWGGHENWQRVAVPDVIARAAELGRRSANPVAVEPGRYTVILEPAAVAAMLGVIDWDAWRADNGLTAFSKEPFGTNKIGLKMMDGRLGVVADLWDPERPQSVIDAEGHPLENVSWFEDGVLQNLEYRPWYAESKGRDAVLNPGGFKLLAKGPPSTLDEMIASTRRGVWVNRLSHVRVLQPRTLLLTGSTRDGTFLIENGKIKKSIKNFRFMESPFFVLNRLEAFGEPIRASRTVVAPRLKVRDFNFTSLTDAV